jgi:glycosyltransferase involved in cell wall biosynthesis
VVAVIVPAHNEAGVIGRLLGPLAPHANANEFELIVVANGCTDETPQVASSYGPGVRVVSIAEPSKRAALRAGDDAAQSFPRVYVDADVEIAPDDIKELADALRAPGILAAGPHRRLALAGRPWLVRCFYSVWTRLPEVTQGLFGRGVIAVSAAGHARIASLPPLQADDLAASLSFAATERLIVLTACSVVQAPWTTRDLLRRRIRVATGVLQVDETPGAPASTARTRPAELLAIIRAAPWLVPSVVVFVSIALIARRGARRAVRRGDYSTWLRDNSTRTRV